MVYRRLRILVWLIVPALFVTLVAGSSASSGVPNAEPAFEIVSPNTSQVFTQDVTPEIARALHMNQVEGVLINDVKPSPLRAGDVILSVNGNRLGCEGDLQTQLARVPSGETFIVEILRDGIIETVTVQRAMAAPAVLPGTFTIRGISVASLSTQNGVTVSNVLIGTAASAAGLKNGDIILAVDGHGVHSADEFLQFMRQLGNLDATLNVLQADKHVQVFVIPSQP
jgi:S1-C subfamily serine protease